MSHFNYDPATNDRRGTCPHCDRRCRVYVRRGTPGGPRVCGWHRSPERDIAFGVQGKACGGIGEVCQEDRTLTPPTG